MSNIVELKTSDFQQKPVLLPFGQYLPTEDGFTKTDDLSFSLLAKAEGDFSSPVCMYQREGDMFVLEECVRIVSKQGDEVVLPPMCVVKTPQGRKFAKDIVLGDQLDSFLCDPETGAGLPEDPDLREGVFEELQRQNFALGFFSGLLVGNGSIARQQTTNPDKPRPTYVMYFCHLPHEEHIRERAELFAGLFGKKARTYQPNAKYEHKVTTFTLPVDYFPQRFLNKEQVDRWVFEKGNLEVIKGYLRGIFECDSCVSCSELRLVQSNLPRLQKIKQMLARFGIFSRIRLQSKAGTYEFYSRDENGEKVIQSSGQKKPSWYLNLVGKSLKDFQNVIGFDLNSKKDLGLQELIKNKVVWTNIDECGEVVEVYHEEHPCLQVVMKTTVGNNLVQTGLNGIKVIL